MDFPSLNLNRLSKSRAGAFYSLFYSGQFVLLGVQLPFFAGWLALNGFSAPEIGLLTGAALIARLLFGPLIAFWADHQSDERHSLMVISCLFAGGGLGLVLFDGKVLIAVSAFLVLWTFGLLVPLTDSAVLRADRNGWLQYGRTRATGSFAFLLTNLAGGALFTIVGIEKAALVMACAAVFSFLMAFALPPQAGSRGGVRPVSWREAPRLLSHPIFVLALIASGFTQGAHAVYYAFSYLRWDAIGYSATTIGTLWATGVIVEIIVLVGARKLIKRRSPGLLLALGGTAAVIRWAITAMEPPLAILFLVQTMHALTFAAAYIGSVEFIDRAAPVRLVNTAMTLMSTTGVGAVTGVATVTAGFLWGWSGPASAYFLMSAMGGVALIASVLIISRWNGKKLFE